ncbi:MAG: type II toxin-antitoxin system VapC family toxin [Caldilineaceae bacterium]|nr:type II toxin-antitoxin system VapC family toxin [Caldilineaceae bacterium]
MSNSPICIDASFLVQFLVNPNTQRLRSLWRQWQRERRLLVAPTLLFYETVNGIYQYQRQRSLSAEAIQQALRLALSFPIQLYGSEEIHARALLLADNYMLAATYDAHYLAVAEKFDAELWTLDRRLYKQMSPLFTWINTVDTEDG